MNEAGYRRVSIPTVISCASAVIAAWLLHAAVVPIGISPIQPSGQQELNIRGSAAPAFITKPASAYKAFADRPLFSPTRRPAPPVSASILPTKGTPTAKEPELIGIVINPNGRKALLKADGGRVQWVSEGDRLSGWKIIEIGRNHAVVSRDLHAIRLLLYADTLRTESCSQNGASCVER